MEIAKQDSFERFSETPTPNVVGLRDLPTDGKDHGCFFLFIRGLLHPWGSFVPILSQQHCPQPLFQRALGKKMHELINSHYLHFTLSS